MSKPAYKTTKKYKCPYCEFKAIRGDLIDHVEKKHSELIPEEYTAGRAVYDSINQNHGTCMVCKKPVYKWNDKINRYYNLCENPKCREHVRKVALDRHMKVYNKPTLLNDPEQQEKMLANRRISGSYTFTDGRKLTYTGKYERNALEFMDKVLNIPSTDIETPGPVLEYKYNGKTHKWITDIYYIPANLLIEIKDGGSNPNNRSMESYREKQIAKEAMITENGNFNYIRLTNNNFAQLFDIFADMKYSALFDNDASVARKIHINEEVGGIPPHRPPEAYIVPYGMNNVFDGFAYGNSESDNIIIDDEDSISLIGESEFYNKYDIGPKLYYTGDSKNIVDINSHIKSNSINSVSNIIEMMVGKEIARPSVENIISVISEGDFKYYSEDRENIICEALKRGVEKALYSGTEDTIELFGNSSIHHSPDGYFATTPKDYFMSTDYFKTKKLLKESFSFKVINEEYDKYCLERVNKDA